MFENSFNKIAIEVNFIFVNVTLFCDSISFYINYYCTYISNDDTLL